MSGTSKKSQGGTQRKLRCMGETNDQIEVKVLTTHDLVADDDDQEDTGGGEKGGEKGENEGLE